MRGEIFSTDAPVDNPYGEDTTCADEELLDNEMTALFGSAQTVARLHRDGWVAVLRLIAEAMQKQGELRF